MSGPRAPYGHRREAADHQALPAAAGGDYRGPTYYDRPALKPSGWGWLIIGYFWVGGIAGSAQLIAALADLTGRRRYRNLVRAGRYVALAGSLASPVLLILDLSTPQRWYNMLRIVRRTSVMSIGSWTLMLFGTLSGAVAVAQAADDLLDMPLAGGLARIVAVPAGAAGAMLSTYTGALLSVTSIPLWSVSDTLLPALFGAGAFTTATATLALVTEALGSDAATQRDLALIGLVATAAELGLAGASEVRWRRAGVAGPLDVPPLGVAYRVGALGLGMVLPLLLHILELRSERRSQPLALLAAVSTLIGGFCLRGVLIFAGKESARRPRDYFGITQPSSGSTR